MKKIILCGLILFSPIYCLAAASAPVKVAPVSVTAQVDKTAILVGDELRYTIHVVRDADVELVLDNFKKDYLPLAPFVAEDIQIREGEWRGKKKKTEITLLLKTFETGKSELTIPSLQLYYFVHKPGVAKKESSVSVIMAPAVKIGLRSTLVSERLALREIQKMYAPPLWKVLAAFVLGLAGVVWLTVRAARWGWKKFHPDEETRRLTHSERKKITEQSLAHLRANAGATGDDPRQWSGAIGAALRDFIEKMLQTSAVGLTPEEIKSLLAQMGIDGAFSAEVKSVLERLDELHYGKNPEAGRGLHSQLLEAAESILTSPKLASL